MKCQTGALSDSGHCLWDDDAEFEVISVCVGEHIETTLQCAGCLHATQDGQLVCEACWNSAGIDNPVHLVRYTELV